MNSNNSMNSDWEKLRRFAMQLFPAGYAERYSFNSRLRTKCMEPFKQGKLDGLCGVYSLVNAEKIVNDSNQQESEEIFKKIIAFLDSTKNLSRIITEGLNINVIGEVLKNIEELKIYREMPFRGETKTELNLFWKEMQSFLDTPSRAILLGIGGKHDHWSVVQSITDKRINFFDSDGLMFFNRINCTTQEPYGDRIHQILPTHTYFLSKKNIFE